jgi:hypothetical protein
LKFIFVYHYVGLTVINWLLNAAVLIIIDSSKQRRQVFECESSKHFKPVLSGCVKKSRAKIIFFLFI